MSFLSFIQSLLTDLCFLIPQGRFPSDDWQHYRRDRILNDGPCRIPVALRVRVNRSIVQLVLSSVFVREFFLQLFVTLVARVSFRMKEIRSIQGNYKCLEVG